jgi:hypothetical protein
MSRLGDKRIRLRYDDWWGMRSEVATIRAATEANVRQLHDVRKRFDRELAAVRDEFSAETAAIHQNYGTRVTALEKAREASQSLAQQWTKTAVALRDELAASDDHERFAAGELAAVARRLAEFADDSGGRAPDASYMMAWTAARDLTELRARVAERAREWETLRTACVDGLTALRERWQDLATQELFGEHDETATVDVDHWSHQAHAVLGAELTSALKAVADPATAPDTTSLTMLLNSELDRYAIRLDQVLRAALAAFRNAQVRAEIFTGVAERMSDRGWQIVQRQMGFENDDQRADLVGTIVDLSGAKIRVRLPAPGEDQHELPVRFERVGETRLPDAVVDRLGTLMQSVVESVARGWATVDQVEELPARDGKADATRRERG